MSTQLEVAIELAVTQHRGQKDDNDEPYILHPLRVMAAMRDSGFDERYMIVAVLHDIIEDTHTPLQFIYDTFGDEIGDAVDAISKRVSDEGAPEGYFDSYIPRVRNNAIANEVKLRDLQDNSDLNRYNGKHGLYARYAKAYGILSE